MLPGFRFLFAAIVLSMSILVFGLGAAALLRAAHEEFASNPSWHAAPEPALAQHADARPVLAMLRVEPVPVPEESVTADNAAAVPPIADQAATPPPAMQAEVPPAATEQSAALKPADTPQAEPAKPEVPASENPAPNEAAAVQADTPAPPEPTKIAAPEAETKVVSTEQASPPAEVSPPANDAAPVAAVAAAPEPAAAEQASAPVTPEIDAASSRIATLGGPPVTIETPPPVKADNEKPDRSAIKKREQARRAAHHRRIAARARLAQQVPQQAVGEPFAQPQAQAPTAARRR